MVYPQTIKKKILIDTRTEFPRTRSLFRNDRRDHQGGPFTILTPDILSHLVTQPSTVFISSTMSPAAPNRCRQKQSNIECVTSDILKANENKRNVRVRPETKPVATAQNTSRRSRRELVNLRVSCRNQSQTHEERVNRRFEGRSHDSIAVSPTCG